MPVFAPPTHSSPTPLSIPAPAPRCFASGGGVEEVFVCLDSEPGKTFEVEALGLLARYRDLLRHNDLDPRNAVWLRLYVKGLPGHLPRLRRICADLGLDKTPMSFLGQRPLRGGRIALDARLVRGHVSTPLDAPGFGGGGMMRIGDYEMIFASSAPPEVNAVSFSPTHLTLTAFHGMKTFLRARRLEWIPHLLRTWIYVRDIDAHYREMSEARNAFFGAHDITPATRCFASTGIGGENESPAQAVKVDWLLMSGTRREQIVHMEAPGHMPPTHRYGVMFERGTRVRFGDRSHYYISGTASIGPDGTILHPGDIRGQARRMVDNARALLDASGATLDDLCQAVVYLRNPTDAPVAEQILGELLPARLPRVVVHGPVCRAGWLIEMEGIAVTAAGDPRFAPLAR